MRLNKAAILAWLFCGVIVVASLVRIWGQWSSGNGSDNLVQVIAYLVEGLGPIVFAVVGALILSYQPRNAIGWLLMLPSLALAIDTVTSGMIRAAGAAPVNVTSALVAATWLSNSIWLLLIFPLFFIALLFPNGSPPSPRWRWVVGFGIGLILFFVIVGAFVREVSPEPSTYGVTWTIPNPIGFIPADALSAIIFPWWVGGLAIFAILSVVSLFVRYRRAGSVERKQIKWLLYACGLFALFYVPGLLMQGMSDLANLAFSVILLGFPLAIGISILRYRLWDIDIIIRRTVTYSIVVTLLGIVFFGSVILLQQIFAQFTNTGGNEIITVVSTLVIAALFVPLRNRIQDVIDKRFNRKKYDAQKVLEKFAITVRDETDIDKLTAELVNVVNETMQPRSVSLWLKRGDGENNYGRISK